MIDEVELRGFISHKRTKFTLHPGATVIIGPTGAGKSSIIDGLTVALFGKHNRGHNQSIVKDNSSNAEVRVRFRAGSSVYEVMRVINKNGSLNRAYLKKCVNGNSIFLASGERRSVGESVSKYISGILGTNYGRLISSAISLQGQLTRLVDMRPREFKNLLDEIVGIDRLNALFEKVPKVVRLLRDRAEKEFGYDDGALPTLEDMINKLKDEMEKLREEIIVLNEKVKKLKSDKNEKEGELRGVRKKIDEVKQGKIAEEELKRKMEELFSYIKTKLGTIKQVLSLLSEVKGKKEEMDEELSEKKTKAKEMDEEIEELKSRMAGIKTRIKIAKGLTISDGRCPVCGSAVKKLKPEYELTALISQLNAIKKKISKKEKFKKELDSEIKTLEELKGKLGTLKTLKETLGIKSEDPESYGRMLRRVGEEVEKEKPDIDVFIIDNYSNSLVGRIRELEDMLKKIDLSELEELVEKEKRLNGEIRKLTQNIGGLMGKADEKEKRIKHDEENLENLSDLIPKLKNLKKEIDLLEKFRSNIYHRDSPLCQGLRVWAIEEIGKRASKIIRDFGVSISMLNLVEEDRGVSIQCHTATSIRDAHALSGGEKVAVALALRLAVAGLSNNPNTDFLILDEPTIHLDEEKRAAFVDIISHLEPSRLKQLIIITHDAGVFENAMVDQVIRLEKRGVTTEII